VSSAAHQNSELSESTPNIKFGFINKKIKNKMFKFGLVQACEFIALNSPTCHILKVVFHYKNK